MMTVENGDTPTKFQYRWCKIDVSPILLLETEVDPLYPVSR